MDNNLIVFSQGVVVGLFLSKYIDYIKNIKKVENVENVENVECSRNHFIQSVYFVCEITDFDMFNTLFPDYPNTHKVQPGWIYKNGTIKINLDIANYLNSLGFFEYFYNDFFNIKKNGEYCIDIDVELFKQFGNTYIYIEYFLNKRHFINVYTYGDEILSTEFQYTNSNSNSNSNFYYLMYEDKEIDITEYFCLFLNNDKPLTLKKILLYYDCENREKLVLKVYSQKNYKIIEYNELIQVI